MLRAQSELALGQLIKTEGSGVRVLPVFPSKSGPLNEFIPCLHFDSKNGIFVVIRPWPQLNLGFHSFTIK